MKYVVAFVLSLATLMWSVSVIAGYVADSVASYYGPTPMALDTAVCIGLLSIVGMILSKYRMREVDE